jgi:glycosyltransferase involved in cell wall biosynthesis
MKVFFSVIIPALNEEHFLPRLLTALKNQKFMDFEVILVDANSTDKTVEVTKSFSHDFPLQVVHTASRNISASRNIGASKANGTYLLFIDADNYIPHNFLYEIAAIMQKPIDMIIPAVVPDSKKFKYKIAYSFVNFLVSASQMARMPFSTGGNMVIKKSVFNAIHGFDETIFVGEDHDIVGRVRKIDANIIFMSKPKVVFSVRRLEKEGVAVLLKYFISTLYIAFFGKITKKIYDYQMGGDYYRKQK